MKKKEKKSEGNGKRKAKGFNDKHKIKKKVVSVSISTIWNCTQIFCPCNKQGEKICSSIEGVSGGCSTEANEAGTRHSVSLAALPL